MKKKTILDILSSKKKKKLVCTTAYTYVVSHIVSEAEFDIILIGDSLGTTLQGQNSTIPVTLEQMIYHSQIVVRGNTGSFIVTDMPFLTTDVSRADSIRNAGKVIQETGVDAVKIEGGLDKADTIKGIIDAGIPVMGHLGLTPQKILRYGKYKVQGKTAESEDEILKSAIALEKTGVFSIVLECIPSALAKKITESISIPTIGIGAGKYCDGQILVSNDLLGFNVNPLAKFVKKYADLSATARDAFLAYKKEVESGEYPSEKHSY